MWIQLWYDKGILIKVAGFSILMSKSTLLAAVAFVAFVAPLAALAQVGVGASPTFIPPPTNQTGPITSVGTGIELVQTILGWVATLFWIGAVIAFFYAGFLYLTSAGEPEKVQKASHMVLYGAIAVAVGLMAYGFPALVNNFLLRR